MIALERIAELKRLLAMRWARLTAWREGNSHLRDGLLVGVSRVNGMEVPWHNAEHRQRDPHDVYLRDEDADLVVAAITLLPELLAELDQKPLTLGLKELQETVNSRWGAQDANPCHGSDTKHALTHMMKALGKIASAVNDAEHEQRGVRPDEVSKYLADLVICAARFADGTSTATAEGGQVDLATACAARLAEKFPKP